MLKKHSSIGFLALIQIETEFLNDSILPLNGTLNINFYFQSDVNEFKKFLYIFSHLFCYITNDDFIPLQKTHI
jgi:hypothetical protein